MSYNYDRTKHAAADGGGSAEFAELLQNLLDIGDRQIRIKSLSLGMSDTIFINFYNRKKRRYSR